MSLINNRFVRHLFIFVGFLAFFNPYVISFFDPHPPLDSIELFLIVSVNTILFLLVLLSYLYGARVVLINFVVVLALLVGLDVVARFAFPDFDHYTFRLENPEPYQSAEYYSPEFLQESFSQPGGHYMKPGTNRVYPQDFEGRWFNVEDGIRKTLYQPEQATQTVYIFGGSTVYNSEVPDQYTIASQLQLMISEISGASVINMGVTSVDSGQQLSRLIADVQLQQDDIVIFYDGVNDVMQRVVYENQEGYIIGKPRTEPFRAQVLRKLASESNIFRVFLEHSENKNVPSAALLDESTKQYVTTLDAASAHSWEYGAYFFHFLQPTIFTKAKKNEYERRLLNLSTTTDSRLIERAYYMTYPKFQSALSKRGFSSDLTDIFDDLDNSPYLDFCHVNHTGNYVIARNIFLTMRDRLKPD